MTVRTAKRWLSAVLVGSGALCLNALLIGETVWALVFAFFFWTGIILWREVGEGD